MDDTEHPFDTQTEPSPEVAAAEAAAVNGVRRRQPTPDAVEELAAVVLRELTLTLRATEEIDTRLETAIILAGVAALAALLTLAMVAVHHRSVQGAS